MEPAHIDHWLNGEELSRFVNMAFAWLPPLNQMTCEKAEVPGLSAATSAMETSSPSFPEKLRLAEA